MKTTLNPAVQLDRTLGLALDYFGNAKKYLVHPTEEDLYGHLVMGKFVKSTRLFNVSDIVVFWFNNGMAQRWPVTGISSKGYRVVDMYAHFQTWYPGHRQYSRRGRMKRSRSGESASAIRNVGIIEQSGQPTKFLDVFRNWSADPTVQQTNVEALRTGPVVRR